MRSVVVGSVCPSCPEAYTGSSPSATRIEAKVRRRLWGVSPSGVADVARADLTFTDSGLTPGAAYWYRVVAVNGAGTRTGTAATVTTASQRGGPRRRGRWRGDELAPPHPSTIAEVRTARDGRLEYLVQQGGATFTLMGATMWAGEAPRIRPERLIPFVWWPDSVRRWLGRSMLRPLSRNWLCKDVLIRVDVTNHERAGGVPWIEKDERYAGQSLEDLARLAAELRVDEEGGAALPPGALLRLARVGGSGTIAAVRYHDEQMAVVWHAMVRMLGRTPNGSRALGGTFADLETLARRALAEWVRRTVNRWVGARYWSWNYGAGQPPVLRFTPPELEAEAAANRPAPPVADPTADNPDPVPEGGGVPLRWRRRGQRRRGETPPRGCST